MKKSDLKNLALLQCRNGAEFRFVEGYFISEGLEVLDIDAFNEDLTYAYGDKEEDIVKVYDTISEVKKTKLVWERKEVDWSKVPFGTKVRCWTNKNNKYAGRLVNYSPNNEYPFTLYCIDSSVYYFKYCELAEEVQEEVQETEVITREQFNDEFELMCNQFDFCHGCSYEHKRECINLNACKWQYIFEKYNVTRK